MGRSVCSRLALAIGLAIAVLASSCSSDPGPSPKANTASADEGDSTPAFTDSSKTPDAAPTSGSTAVPIEASGPDSSGAATLNDPYVDTFGNGGYDVDHYDLFIDWDPELGALDGVASIKATATQELDQFNLDFVGMTISDVTVNGESARFVRDGFEVAITPAVLLPSGEPFTVKVSYNGTPGPPGEPILGEPAQGWQTRDGFSYVAGEPISASTWHPANDHPSDKATFQYTIIAPSDLTVAANGTLKFKTAFDDTTTWVYDQPFPQATYLSTVIIGDFSIVDGGTSASGIPIRNVFDSSIDDVAAIPFANQPAMIDEFETLFGPYPFDVYGSAVVLDSIGGALETQTLSIYGVDVVGFGALTEKIISHELAHQWFGNSVSLAKWDDIWLNEGFASYAEALWLEASDPDFSYDQWITEILYSGPDLLRHTDNPEGDLFAIHVYQRGALTLHGLRLEMGDDAFFELLRTWAEDNTDGNVTTEQFEALAADLHGSDLSGLFDQWLRTEAMPAEIGGISVAGVDDDPRDFELDVFRLAIGGYATCLDGEGEDLGIDAATAEPLELSDAISEAFLDLTPGHMACVDTLEPLLN